MKRWKALVLLGTLCLGLLLPWQAVAQEEPAGQLAEESGAAGVTEQLDWDVQSVLEHLGPEGCGFVLAARADCGRVSALLSREGIPFRSPRGRT